MTDEKKKKISAVVKWAGGKSQLLDSLTALMPKKYGSYHEPFLGGGALFLNELPQSGTINDLNDELMTTYQVIKDNPAAIIKALKKLVKGHNDAEHAKDYYYSIREKDVSTLSDEEVAARFIYLNKTGFNGLYRVNASGKFNVPFGKKETITNSTVFSDANIRNLSKYLNKQEIQLFNEDFGYVLEEAKEGDFVFIDSPYDDSWSGYQAGGFGEYEHRRLSDIVKQLDQKGVKFMLTNHNTPLIEELYGGFKKFEIPVNRFINADATNRANATNEVIFVNYELTKDQLREFNITKFFKQLKPTSFVLKDYVKWEKLQERIKKNELALNDLNLLFANNEDELKEKFEKLYEARPESFEILPLLISVRNKKFVYLDEEGDATEYTHEDKDVVYGFLKDSGLLDNVFINAKYRSITDYLLGLEVGLSSADKKNLSGTWLVHQIEKLLTENGIEYNREIGYDTVLNMTLDRDKVFDFVFEIGGKKYCMEVNFFNTSGSKINSESARFVDLNRTFYNYSDLEFVWVTDGVGLRNNKAQLTQALKQIEHLFNLTTFEDFLKEITA